MEALMNDNEITERARGMVSPAIVATRPCRRPPFCSGDGVPYHHASDQLSEGNDFSEGKPVYDDRNRPALASVRSEMSPLTLQQRR